MQEGGPYFTRLPANFIDIIELADSMNELIEEAEFGSDLHKAAILVEKPVDPDMDGRAWIFFLDRKHEDDDRKFGVCRRLMLRFSPQQDSCGSHDPNPRDSSTAR